MHSQYKHGDAVRGKMTKLYYVWANIKDRCLNPKNKRFKDYGGRGIKFFVGWEKYIDFKKWAHRNGYAEGLHIDRIDNNKGYSPKNCRFVSPQISAQNKRTSKKLNYFGEMLTTAEAARKFSIPESRLYYRINRGMNHEQAVKTPKLKRNEIKKILKAVGVEVDCPPHEWDRGGERCIKCGQKDWM